MYMYVVHVFIHNTTCISLALVRHAVVLVH